MPVDGCSVCQTGREWGLVVAERQRTTPPHYFFNMLCSFHSLHLLHPSISILPWAVSWRDGRVDGQLRCGVEPITFHHHYTHTLPLFSLWSTSIRLFSSPAPWQLSPSDLLPVIIIHITDVLWLWPFGLQGRAERLFARWPHVNPSLWRHWVSQREWRHCEGAANAGCGGGGGRVWAMTDTPSGCVGLLKTLCQVQWEMDPFRCSETLPIHYTDTNPLKNI